MTTSLILNFLTSIINTFFIFIFLFFLLNLIRFSFIFFVDFFVKNAEKRYTPKERFTIAVSFCVVITLLIKKFTL